MFSIASTRETAPNSAPLYYCPRSGHQRPWVYSPDTAARYPTKRAAFAAAMAADASRMVPRGCALAVVPAVLA